MFENIGNDYIAGHRFYKRRLLRLLLAATTLFWAILHYNIIYRTSLSSVYYNQNKSEYLDQKSHSRPSKN